MAGRSQIKEEALYSYILEQVTSPRLWCVIKCNANKNKEKEGLHVKEDVEKPYYGYRINKYIAGALIGGGIVGIALAIIFTILAN